MKSPLLLLLLLSLIFLPSTNTSKLFEFEGDAIIISPLITLSCNDSELQGFHLELFNIHPASDLLKIEWWVIDFIGFEYTEANKFVINITRESEGTWSSFNFSLIFHPRVLSSQTNLNVSAIIAGAYSDSFLFTVHNGSSLPLYPPASAPEILLPIIIPAFFFSWLFIYFFFRKKKSNSD